MGINLLLLYNDACCCWSALNIINWRGMLMMLDVDVAVLEVGIRYHYITIVIATFTL